MNRHYKFPSGCSQYGAQMGRRDNITENNFPVKFRLFEVELDSGGYDNGGAYWEKVKDCFTLLVMVKRKGKNTSAGLQIGNKLNNMFYPTSRMQNFSDKRRTTQ